MINRLCIIGVGLIGGSLARAAKRAGVCREVVGVGRNEVQLRKAVELGVIDRFTSRISEAVAGADMVVLAVPLGSMEEVLRQMSGHLAPDAVVTDVGSAKGSVMAAVRAVFKEVPPNFVPGHPIAGTEKSGVEASFAELFEDRRVILTPLPETNPDALAKVRRLWEAAGAKVVEMGVEHHDEVLAATSHLPHLLAFTLVEALARMDESEEIFRYSAGGFRDFTRIASSDPVMWRDICLANRDAILAMLERYMNALQSLSEAVRQGDGEHLAAVFARAKAARDRYVSNQVASDNSEPK